jgi:histidinol-phosphate aminotransferase
LSDDPKKAATPILPHIRALPPRHFPQVPASPDEAAARRGQGPLRLSLNERPTPPAQRVIDAILTAATTVNRYPASGAPALAARFAALLEVPADRVVIGNGSDELIDLVGRITLGPGDEVVMPTPSFPIYRHAAIIADAKPVAVGLAKDGAADVDALLGAVTPATKLVFAPTVNNPTGGVLSANDLERLAGETPAQVMLAVDDAYFDFIDVGGHPDALSFLRKRTAPWVLLRTMSKSYGIAGLRVGYMVAGDAATAQAILQVKPTFNVNAIAQAAALAALDERDAMRAYVAQAIRDREQLAEDLRGLSLAVLPSGGNFITARLPVTGMAATTALKGEGILVAPVPEPGYEDCLRITIGTAAENARVVAALKTVLGA